MIAFVSLFLGLVSGSQVVEVAVAERVATVELRLDGRPVGHLAGPPWRAEVDFGDELATHRLEAVARSRTGAEVGRAVQQINVPRSDNEVEVLLEGWREGRPRWARVIWHSRRLVDPVAISVSLDGRPLSVRDPARIELPPVAAESIHFISAELTFPGDQRSTAQAIFGGRYGEEVESELTAVPVLLSGRRLKRPEEAAGWLRLPGGEAPRVAALEDEAARVFVVRDEAALPDLRQLRRRLKARHKRAYRRLGLEAPDRLFLVSARAAVTRHAERDYELYPISRGFGLEEVPLPEALAFWEVKRQTDTEQRLADAVAVAGVRAATGGRRRAVLVVVDHCDERHGRWSGETVRRYLAELRVPLEVWAIDRPDAKAGGLCRDARWLVDADTYGSALARLRRLLKRQQILWIEGSHLPRDVALAAGTRAKEVAPLD